ncbi:tRNA lysidine(34) synthetase TilS [Taibaiella soli]|uniref:tRNA(Ile)-lysidine synthase n=1 Tax=Taibaiella soli TaxID=1649169 RepID=A0A2W2C2E8_9BACT|nr:tRNA lysidine(34) synthetase TilS [Taibaiella soli]PZF74263.1 tRNA lysidine(34) synthetase TilS [Taibaiella soli]
MTKDLLQLFRENWKSKQLAEADQQILLAVSGGVDSMVLADLFRRSGIKFGMAHCNYQLRDEASNLDEQLVTDWAKQHDIPFFQVRFDTKKVKEEWKMGTQEAARVLRYEWLDNLRTTHGYHFIATAHHANDNVETVLMNLFKGTGISGLHGIREKNDRIIRPLLFVNKEEIRQYAAENAVPFREDASNETDVYLRNAIRNNVIPVVEARIPNVVQQVNESIARFAQAEVLYRKQIEKEKKRLIEQRGKDWYIPVKKLRKQEALETMVYELFHPYGFSSAQVSQLLQLLETETGHYANSATHRVIRHRDFLVITEQAAEATDLILIEGAPGVVHTADGSLHLSIHTGLDVIPTDKSIACVDFSKMEFPLVLRKWKIGDYFYPFGMNMKKKKVSKFFIEQKLAIHEKERAWVLVSGERIVWVAGMRLDERFKLKPDTQHVLKMEWR